MQIDVKKGITEYSSLIHKTPQSVVDNNLCEYCAECKGKCCKSYACGIYPNQVKGLSVTNSAEENAKILINLLHTNIVSIDAYDMEYNDDVEYLKNQGITDYGFRLFYFRIRHTMSNIVDMSWGGKCICLTENGCMMDSTIRPMEGLLTKCEKTKYGQIVDVHTLEVCSKLYIGTLWAKYPIDWDMLFKAAFDMPKINTFPKVMF